MLLDLVLPERCAGCREPGRALCAACRSSLRALAEPLCARCGAPVAWPVARCRECAGRRLAFRSARAAVAYDGVAVALVSAWKQGGRRRLDAVAAEIVLGTVARPEAAAVTAVPAVADRERWRGHNPSERLARVLAPAWGIPFARLLRRAAQPRPQRGLPAADRRRNVSGSFAPRGRCPASVALVDDVYTTGATVEAAAAALRRGGAREVVVVTFARALRR